MFSVTPCNSHRSIRLRCAIYRPKLGVDLVFVALIPWLVRAGPVHEADLIAKSACVVNVDVPHLDVPALGQMLKVSLDGQGQRRLRSGVVPVLISVGEGDFSDLVGELLGSPSVEG